MKEKKKKSFSTIILIVILIVGLILLLYPTVSDYWNSFHQTRAIASYTQSVEQVDSEEYDKFLANAQAYNQTLLGKELRFFLSEEETETYNSLLDVTGTGIMGYIEIPKIECTLPIYHGTDEGVLQVAIGHIEGTSLPVGGSSTHCVVSGHRGLPSAKLFTELDELVKGDLFMLRVLDEVFTYSVDQILIVEPDDVSALEIERGKDLCTLVTCTPYGINTHRLLVRGHRVENLKETSVIRVTADATQIEPLLVAPIVAMPILLVLLVFLLFDTRKKGNKRKREENE